MLGDVIAPLPGEQVRADHGAAIVAYLARLRRRRARFRVGLASALSACIDAADAREMSENFSFEDRESLCTGCGRGSPTDRQRLELNRIFEDTADPSSPRRARS